MPKVIKGGGFAPGSGAPKRKAVGPMRPHKPIIEKEVVDAKHDARRIIAHAEEDALRLVEEARTQVQTIRDNAYREGQEEAAAEFTQKMIEALQDLEAYKQQIEPEYIGLVRTCVEKILGQELRINPDAVVGIVRATLRDATQQREINVRVHPADVKTLRQNQRRLLDVLARASVIEIREDESVQRGGCIVVTELGTIDASLDRQLAAIEDALQEELVAVEAGVLPTEYEEEDEYEDDFEGDQ